MNCKICLSLSKYAEKTTKIPYCSKSCQFIGNDIMKLPNELIENIVIKLNGSEITNLLKADEEFKIWFFEREYLFERITHPYNVMDVRKMSKVYDVWFIQKYFTEPTQMIREGESVVFENHNDEQVMFSTIFDGYEENLLFSFDNQDIIYELKREGITGNVWNYPIEEDGFTYHMIYYDQIFLKALWDLFGYKYIYTKERVEKNESDVEE